METASFRFANIPFEVRAAHHWIIGGSGHGKTQALQHLISLDIPKIIMGEMSVIVIDSQSRMLPLLASLDVWTQSNRLVYVDPAHNPPALNLFDIKGNQNLNTVLESYRFIINSILVSSEFTGSHGLLFDMLMQLMLKIPGANIHTFIDLLSDTGIKKPEIQEAISKLPPSPRTFFEAEYIKGGRSDQYQPRRAEVTRRLWQILANPTFDQMFSARTMSIDFVQLMQEGKLILIDTNKGYFAETNSAIVGALFVGLLYQAILSRDEGSKPCIVYIDECAEYFQHNGATLRQILAEARKRNVGIVMAHQDLDQLNKAPGLFGALSANTAIKMAGGTSHHDAKALAPMLKTVDPNTIFDTTKGEFVTYIPRVWAEPQLFSTDFGRMERMPRASSTRPTPPTPEPELAFATDPPPERPKPGGRQTF
jgi:type IV secretory pathway VirB4 component